MILVAVWCSYWWQCLRLQAKFTGDKRSIWVTTKANAPGGARTEKVGLPYDPELLDHMVEHGVIIEVQPLLPIQPVIQAIPECACQRAGSCRGLVCTALPHASCILDLALVICMHGHGHGRAWRKASMPSAGVSPSTSEMCVRADAGGQSL